MFYKLYKSIKTELAGLDFITAVTWFNNQYEQGSVVDTSIMVEFNPDAIKQLMSKDTTAVDMPIRLHFANKLLSGPDGTLRDTAIEAFNNQLADVIATLDGANLLDTDLTALTLRPLQLAGVSPFQKTNGWQIWLIDFTAKVDKQTLKNSIEQITITTTVTGNGTITSQPADLTIVKKGQLVILSANPASGSTFTNWTVDGVVQTASLIYFKAIKAITAVAEFASNQLTERLKTFHTAPVNRGNWYFGDYSGQDNDVSIKGQKIAYFSGQNVYIDTLLVLPNTSFTFCIDVLVTSTKETEFLGGSASTQILLGNYTNGLPSFYIATLPSATTLVGTKYNKAGDFIRTVYIFDKESEKIKIINQYESVEISTTGKTFTPNTLTMRVSGRGGTRTLNGFFGELVRYDRALTNVEAQAYVDNRTYFENKRQHLMGNHGQGAVMYDISGNNNHGTVTGAVLSTFWGSTSNEAEPYEHSIGATLYRNTTDNSIMPICGDNNLTISGFTRIGYFAPGSGALKGLPNTYTIPFNTELNAIIPAGDYTADQLAALTTSENLVIEQDADRIISLTVKTL